MNGIFLIEGLLVMDYQVVLPEYEGPLDLLLHLIDEHELDIYDIPIAFITDQYMDYLRKAEEVDLNLSGEFLVMAGTLLLIKAKTLLPQKADAETGEEGEPGTMDELVAKLLAYRIYKENAEELKRMEGSNARIFFREVNEGHLLSLFPKPNPVGDLKPMDLFGSFNEILRLMAARGQTITIHKETASVNDKMGHILGVLSRQVGAVPFHALFNLSEDLMGVITTFLALLELLSKGRVWVRQTELFGDIYVGAAERGASRTETPLQRTDTASPLDLDVASPREAPDVGDPLEDEEAGRTGLTGGAAAGVSDDPDTAIAVDREGAGF